MAERGQTGRQGEAGPRRSIDGCGNVANTQKLPAGEWANDADGNGLGLLTINTEHLQGFRLSPNYTELQPIGFGVHGLVVSALDQVKQRRVAAKKIKVESQISCRYALREVRILSQMKHDNIVHVLDVLLDPNNECTPIHHTRTRCTKNLSATTTQKPFQLYIISELLDTNLHVLITQRLLEAEHVTLITYQLMRGLHYLRSANVVHRDLKPSNLFINCDTLLLKIGDFGLARIVDPNYSHAGHLTADLGTYWYRAPELMLSPRSYTPAVDIWGAGCVLAEMLLGKPVFTGATDVDQLRHIIDAVELNERDWSAVLHVLPNRMLHQHPLTPQRPLAHRLNDVDPLVVDLLENLLVFDPLQRMSPVEALAHPYLQMYAKPDKEPVAAEPFAIESEVDDLPTEHLKNMIHEEKNNKRGKCGLCIPVPSPVDRPKVSSATLSLKVGGDKNQRTVPTSPTFDNIIHEQRRNRRNKMSASVDLSFISLPSADKQCKLEASPSEPQKGVYSTSNFPTKEPAPPCPWKWPEVQTAPPGKPVQSSPTVTKPGAIAAAASIDMAVQKEDDALIFKHVPNVATKRSASLSQQTTHQPSVPPGFSAHPATKVNMVQTDKEDPGPKLRRVRPKRRSLTDVSGIDPAEFIQLGLPDGDTRRHSTEPLTLGKIETYEEKDQSCIDRELNRRNRTASMDLSYVTTPHVQYSPAAVRLRSSAGTRGSRELTSSSAVWKSNTSSALRRRMPEAIVQSETPVPAATPTPLLGDGLRKRSNDVGIRIIKSPKPQRKMFGSSIESQSPITPTERRYSTAHLESSSPVTPTERKLSVCSMDSSQASSRRQSWEERQRGSNSSLVNSVNQPQSASSAKYSRPKSISPLLLTRTQAIEDRCNGKSSQLASWPVRIETPPELKDITSRIEQTQEFSSHTSEDEHISFSSGNDTNKNSDYPDDLTERPPSVVSTLTISGLSPMLDIPYTPKRKVSQTTLFLDDISVNKEISQIENGPNPRDRCTSTEPPRCSSRLSVDLSFVNKEQQKWEEEEKDKVEVSPRKLQEDWEIESQSSQKSEWTLGEILGVSEEEVTGGVVCHLQQQPPTLSDNGGASASLHRTQETPVSAESSARKVCRTKIDLIPYRVLTPDLAQQPRALTTYVEDRPPSETTPNNDCKSATAKLEDLSLDSKKKTFTAEFFVGSTGDSLRKPSGQELPREPTVSKRDQSKDHLHLDFKTPHPHRIAHGMVETPSASILSKFSQYKSEEDLVSPRSHSPRDVVGARATTSRDMPDLPGFKQSVKENLSSLNVSIPKDFPEKRRLIKAHSTESVCSEGESSSHKAYDSSLMDRSTEDLIQFSPVGSSKGEQQQQQQQQEQQIQHHHQQQPPQQWRTYSALKDETQGSHPECNHCLYQGDCNGPTCGNPTGPAEGPRKNDALLQKPLTPQRMTWHGNEPTLLGESEAQRRAQVARRAGVRSSLDELCYSKDVFNERQKLMGGGHQSEHDHPTGDNTVYYPWRRARPKSAKN